MVNDIQYLLNKYKINFNNIEIIKEYYPNWANLHHAQYFSTFFLDKKGNVIFSSKIPTHKDTDVLPQLIFYCDKKIEEKVDMDLFLEWKQKIKSKYFKHTDLSFLEFKRNGKTDI